VAEREHHKTKRTHYTIVLVPNEDAAQSRNFRFVPWQLALIAALAVVCVIGLFVGALVYTPLGAWLSIPNPELENRYGREFVALNNRMADMMSQLLELRTYNAMLRNALGDKGRPDTSALRREALRAEAARDDMQSAQGTDLRYASTPAGGLQSIPRQELTPTTAFPALFPTEGYVTRGFEPDRGHFGLDIAGKVGTPIRAAADGYVVFAGWTLQDGNIIIVSHTGGFLTFYKHNHALMKNAGMFVRRGESVAVLGNTGESSLGPHVHFEVWKDGSPRDPALYLLNPNS